MHYAMLLLLRARVPSLLLFSLLLLWLSILQPVWAQPDPNAAIVGRNPPEELPGAAVINETLLNLQLLKPDGAPLSNSRVALTLQSVNFGHTLHDAHTSAKGQPIVLAGTEMGRYSVYAYVPQVGAAYLKDVEVKAVNNKRNPPLVQMRLQDGGLLKIVVRTKAQSQAMSESPPSTTTPPTTIQPDTIGQPGPVAGLGAEWRALGGCKVRLEFLQDKAKGDAVLVPTSRIEVARDWTTRDGSGTAVIQHLAPGHYAVTVQPMPGYLPAWQIVNIGPNANASLNFDLEPEVPIPYKITLQDEKGQPVRDTDLIINFAPADNSPLSRFSWQRTVGMNTREVHTDANGDSVLFPVRPGRWTISGHNDQLRVQPIQVEIPRTGGKVTLKVSRNGQDGGKQ